MSIGEEECSHPNKTKKKQVITTYKERGKKKANPGECLVCVICWWIPIKKWGETHRSLKHGISKEKQKNESSNLTSSRLSIEVEWKKQSITNERFLAEQSSQKRASDLDDYNNRDWRTHAGYPFMLYLGTLRIWLARNFGRYVIFFFFLETQNLAIRFNDFKRKTIATKLFVLIHFIMHRKQKMSIQVWMMEFRISPRTWQCNEVLRHNATARLEVSVEKLKLPVDVTKKRGKTLQRRMKIVEQTHT